MTTVLIVDDHASFRLQAGAILAAAGYLVVGEAPDGRTALELARALAPEIVLLDIGLPDLDGFEVARQLAGAAVRPIVVLTSSREAGEFGPRLADAPVAGFIVKERLSGGALGEIAAAAKAKALTR